MNANDAQLIEIMTARHGSTVEDNAPNAPAPGQDPAGSYDVVIEGNAGNVIGNSGTPYTLTVTAMDLTTMTAATNLNPVIGPQTFSAPAWSKNGPDNYYTQQSFTITVPNPNTYSGHVLQYVASLVSVNDQVVSILESEPFTLL